MVMLQDKSFFWISVLLFLLECHPFRLSSHQSKRLFPSKAPPLFQSAQSGTDGTTTELRNRLASELLTAAKEVGQVGKLASDEDRRRLNEIAQKLKPFSDPQPSKFPLQGTHYLVYSGSDSGPTAGLLGPFVGKVTQFFWNETVYQNRVQFGPLQVSIFGEKKIVDHNAIKVRFYETQVHLWNNQVCRRELEYGRRGGTWDLLFVGNVMFRDEQVLLRVMNTPKLFVLLQPTGSITLGKS